MQFKYRKDKQYLLNFISFKKVIFVSFFTINNILQENYFHEIILVYKFKIYNPNLKEAILILIQRK